MKELIWKLIGYRPGIIHAQFRLIATALFIVALLLFFVWALQGFPTHFERV